jgi:hypothetical protein
MPLRYEYDQDQNIVNTYPYDELSTLEIADYFIEMIKDDEIRMGFIELVNFENVENFLISYNEAEKIIKAYNALNELKNIRATIFIAERDLHYGMARMLQTLHEMNNSGDNMFVVRTEERAKQVITEMEPHG